MQPHHQSETAQPATWPAALADHLPVEGPSYTPLARALLAMLGLGLMATIAMVLLPDARPASPEEIQPLLPWLLGATVIMAAQAFTVFAGRTLIDEQGVRQTGVWNKQMRWEEIRSARYLGLPWGTLWMPPRLALRSVSGKYMLIQGGTEELHRAFAQIVLHVQSRMPKTP